MKQTFNPCDECSYSFSKNNQESSMCKICEFKDYINAEKQGLLMRFPCKVGDTIYHIWNVDDKQEIQEIKIATLNNLVAHMEYGNFGKTVFLTQAEAEQKLKEMKNR